MKQTSYIIVPTPAVEFNASGKVSFPNYEITGGKRIYTGSELRLRAAQEALKRYKEAKLLAVGGVRINGEGKLVSRAKLMADFLAERINELGRVEFLDSLPSTKHNLVAVYNWLKLHKGKAKLEALITNRYHISRLKAFAAILDREYGFRLNIESFLGPEDFSINPEEDLDDEAYERRLLMEQKGLADLEAGRYRETFWDKPEIAELLERLESEGLTDNFLTPKELSEFKLKKEASAEIRPEGGRL